VKSQRAYVEHVIASSRRIFEDAAPGREAVFSSRTLQDAIIRNLQVLCESTQRVDAQHKAGIPRFTGPRSPECETFLCMTISMWTFKPSGM